jgi:hypothetical protein
MRARTILNKYKLHVVFNSTHMQVLQLYLVNIVTPKHFFHISEISHFGIWNFIWAPRQPAYPLAASQQSQHTPLGVFSLPSWFSLPREPVGAATSASTQPTANLILSSGEQQANKQTQRGHSSPSQSTGVFPSPVLCKRATCLRTSNSWINSHEGGLERAVLRCGDEQVQATT